MLVKNQVGIELLISSIFHVKLSKVEDKYAQEKKQRSILQKQITSCIQEKENHHKQKMEQVLLDLKVCLYPNRQLLILTYALQRIFEE